MSTEREKASSAVSTAELADLVAHEVNNQLNSIVLHVALMERALPSASQAAVQPELEIIRQAVKRASTMLKGLQHGGHKPPAMTFPEAVDLHQVVRDLLPRRMQNPAGETVAVSFQPAPKLPRVLGHLEDIKQLVSLLLQNAAHASPAGGTITVRSGLARGQVLLSVEDQGPEVGADLVEHVFEPFVTIRAGLFPGSDEEQLWLPTCKILARRQKGTIEAARGGTGGLLVTVRFTAASGEQV